MKFKSAYHGELEYTKDDIITFNKSLIGFESLKKFIILDIKENPKFKLLHSLEDEGLAFIVVSPFNFKKDYEVKLKDEVIKELNIEKEDDVMVLNTVTLNSDPSKITTNLRAPIIINIKNKNGQQIILENEKYKIKHPLIGVIKC